MPLNKEIKNQTSRVITYMTKNSIHKEDQVSIKNST